MVGRERRRCAGSLAGQEPERREADRRIDRVVLEQRERGRGRVDHDDAEGHERHRDDHEQLLGAARLRCAERLMPVPRRARGSARRAPRSRGTGRRRRRPARAGRRRRRRPPGRDPHGALERPGVDELDARAANARRSSPRGLADQVAAGRPCASGAASGAKPAPLSEPPRITCSGASKDASACSVASTLVALESLT